MEVITVNEVPCHLIKIDGNGACLFSTLSYLIHGNVSMALQIRTDIVRHVADNWQRFKPYSQQVSGAPYGTKRLYVAEMSLYNTYGTTCELMAAGEIFPFEFQVFQNGSLIASFGHANQGVKRLRFTGNYNSGHFDALVSIPDHALISISEDMDTDSVSHDIHKSLTSCETIMSTSPDSMFSRNIPTDTKKRRIRFTDQIRKKQLARAAVKYTKINPEIHKAAVTKYTQNHPQVHINSVKIYKKNNKDRTRISQEKYNNKKSKTSLLPWSEKYLSGFQYDSRIDYYQDSLLSFGSRSPCSFCRALKWKEEAPGLCCNGGKLQLPAVEPYPEPLHSLLTHQHLMSEKFLKNIRKYNSCFQMTSFGGKEVKEGNFMPTFKVQGQVYHRIGSLQAENQQTPSFLQIYFVGDNEAEKTIRCGINRDVDAELIGELQIMLHNHNRYVKDFKAAIDSIPKDQEDFRVIINADKKPPGEHPGRYNSPSTKEVAILIVGQDFEKRDIVIKNKNNKLLRISETHRAYDALQYPLMFCRGEDGYYINIPQIDQKSQQALKKTVSAANFYSYRIMEREGETQILMFRNLLNQFLVDMFAKIETERLNYIRHNQTKLRTEEYVHLKDAITRSDCDPLEMGKMVVLPSSFTGSPRYMHERTQDAMSYVRHYGRPDLFITFTFNPKWPEISNLLKNGQKSHDRNDLVARVFNLKVKKIMKLLTKGSIFGTYRCHIYSIEWQKRGLPHVHILLWLEDKIRPESIDKIIWAEIPDPQADPVLHEIIKTTMIHGPCGPLNRNSPCIINGVCSKKFPKSFLKETETGEDGYPKYRRRSPYDGGFTAIVRGIEIDNRFVVPYNPVLSRTFQAHINVEYCNSVKSIKYICKYVNKGSDQATFTVETLDEVTRYESGRYISSSEAAWRIMCFSIHDRYPPVMHLAVHLENGQRVYYTGENVIHRINNPPQTTLLAFFELCKKDAFAKTLLYSEVPAYYVWKSNQFFRRKQGKPVPGHPGLKKDPTLGRVYAVHPGNSECFYLRLLLHEIRGPESFTSLKTVNGIVHPSFQAVCQTLGLLEDDAHWDHSLQEACVSNSPRKLRQLFSTILVFCQVGNPLNLWIKYKEHLAEDIRHSLEKERTDSHLFTDLIFNKCLLNLEEIVLSISGKTLTEFGLPSPIRDERETLNNRQYLDELSYDSVHLTETVSTNFNNLNDDQTLVYHKVMESVNTDLGSFFFLDAPGGTGKTYLINLLLASIRRKKKIAIAVASSGIAATLIDGGKTAHSAFKLPLNLNNCETASCNISKQCNMARVLRETKIIIWDECTMAHKGAIEALDRTLRDLRGCSKIMGGVTMLLAGDFRQTLPVVPRGTRADEVKACLKSSILWPHVIKLSLKINMRVHLLQEKRAEEFSRLLLDIGNGLIPENADGKVNIPANLCRIVGDLKSLTDLIYQNLSNTVVHCGSWLRERAILTPKNSSANEVNILLLENMPTELIKYDSIDSVTDIEDAVHYPVEFLHTLDPPGLPTHVLHLKVGAPIMLLRNINPPKLCNGTRLQINSLKQYIIEATIITGIGQGETVLIPRIPLITTDYHFEFKRLQFPVKLCYAMTINKSQGQSLKVAGVDLRNDCFSHGQLYVACSRVSSPDSLVILQEKKTTRNVVYKEVLR